MRTESERLALEFPARFFGGCVAAVGRCLLVAILCLLMSPAQAADGNPPPVAPQPSPSVNLRPRSCERTFGQAGYGKGTSDLNSCAISRMPMISVGVAGGSSGAILCGDGLE